ncbi:class F sortase [Streptomyces sp. NPDC005393]|uniref:class F sortase n=1 Tax=Streptomyces sp. NPDC005393 TaxID=3157041 RepID=UPI0033AD7473
MDEYEYGYECGKRFAGLGRLAMGVAWAALLLGLWMWGRDTTEGTGGPVPMTGDVAAVGRPPAHPLPPAHAPLTAAQPKSVMIKAAGVRAPIVASGLDRSGAVKPPPFSRPGTVGWYRAGPEPGSPGAALLVGHLDTKSKPAVFYGLSDLKRGERVRVARSDGTTAEFTVEDVEVVTTKRFDARRVYGARSPDRAELRLITCGGKFDRATRTYAANVVVSAYLTGTTGPSHPVSAGGQASR